VNHVVEESKPMSKKLPARDRRNLTVQLDERTLRRAKSLAAREGTSVTRLVASTLERLVSEDDAYEEAKRRALAMLEKPLHMGRRRRFGRDELHER
jgi:hypothetical protein